MIYQPELSRPCHVAYNRFVSVIILCVLQQQINQMLNLCDYQFLPIGYVSLNIAFVQHDINLSHSV